MMPALQSAKDEKRCTYADYCTWNGDGRCELIDGVPHLMAPVPSGTHQDIILRLGRRLRDIFPDEQP